MKTQETQQHGEAALLAQIAELQKQLDDCMETADTVRIRPQIELESAAEFFCWGVTDEEHKGTILLRDAIQKLYDMEETRRYDLEDDEVDELMFVVQIMIQCQRLSMAMDKHPEPSA
jgi:hypothetical protein